MDENDIKPENMTQNEEEQQQQITIVANGECDNTQNDKQSESVEASQEAENHESTIDSSVNSQSDQSTRQEVDELNEKLNKFEEKCKNLEQDNLVVKTQLTEALTRNEKFEAEVLNLKVTVKQKDTDAQKLMSTIQQLQNDYKLKLDQMQESQKDKQSIIMKYAETEKRLMDSNLKSEQLRAKTETALKDKQMCIEKYEKLQIDKQKLNDTYETLKMKFDHLKEQHVMSEAKLNISQNKLKVEQTSLTELRLAYDKLKLDFDQKCVTASDEALNEKLNLKYNDLIEENNILKDKLVFFENDYKQHEQTINRYNDTLQNQKQMNKDLLTEILQLRDVQATLTKEQAEKSSLLEKLDKLTSELNEANLELTYSKQKQTELLKFTEKLTEKNSSLQSNNTVLTEKLSNLQTELDCIKLSLQQSDETIKTMSNTLNQKLNEQFEQNKYLTEKLDENLSLVNELTTKLNDEKDENNTLKKRHAANIKDLSKQIQKLQSQLESKSVSSSNTTIPRSNSIHSLIDLRHDQNDMKSINGSISSTDSTPQHHQQLQLQQQMQQQQQTYDDNYVYVVDVDKQKIIEKIVKLQKTLAKKNEKIDFLQDHVNQLTTDVQKKTKIIQAYAMTVDVGVLTSNHHDAHKREMSRKTGIMASLYGSSTNSHSNTTVYSQLNGTHMTMDLCLEINGKLQALLEDTLIKNITLKENLETLGQEIARLSQENRQIQMKSQ